MNDDTLAERYLYNGHVVEIHYDTDPMDPRENDNVGTMVCWHPRHNLGDVDGRKEYGTGEGFEEWANELEGDDRIAAMLPLYLYDHGGITMSTSRGGWPFNCPWDCGQVGCIYVTRKTVFHESPHKGRRMTAANRKWAEDFLVGEVEEYDQYLTGQVYGFVTYKAEWHDDVPEDERDEDNVENGEMLDSCWGFYGDDTYVKSEAESTIDYTLRTEAREHIESAIDTLAPLRGKAFCSNWSRDGKEPKGADIVSEHLRDALETLSTYRETETERKAEAQVERQAKLDEIGVPSMAAHI